MQLPQTRNTEHGLHTLNSLCKFCSCPGFCTWAFRCSWPGDLKTLEEVDMEKLSVKSL